MIIDEEAIRTSIREMLAKADPEEIAEWRNKSAPEIRKVVRRIFEEECTKLGVEIKPMDADTFQACIITKVMEYRALLDAGQRTESQYNALRNEHDKKVMDELLCFAWGFYENGLTDEFDGYLRRITRQ